MSSEIATTLARKSPVTSSGAAIRIFVITDHSELGRAIEHHITTVWADAESRIYSPLVSGRLHPAFTAAGYDAIVLDDRVERGLGIQWLRNLRHRDSIPPILYLARSDDPET